jgi:HK97 family phage prohead protease
MQHKINYRINSKKRNKILYSHLTTKAVTCSDAPGQFSGYASMFNIEDHAGDIIVPGAFSRTLSKNSTVKMLWQHDPEEPIGYFTELREDKQGLFVRGQILLDVERGKEAYTLIKKGALDGLSIGFHAKDYFYEGQKRCITDLDLWEISIVTFPANYKATITDVKSVENPEEIKLLLEILTKANNVLKSLIGI